MTNTMITGHSGFENTGAATLNSVATAIRMGLDCVEVDVRLDPEGVLRLSHDDFKNYKEAVLLRDAFELIAKSDICVNVDLKMPEALYPVINLAEECGFKPGQLIFSGRVEGTALDADACIAERARIFWNIEEIFRAYFMSDEEYTALRALSTDEWLEPMEKLMETHMNEFVEVVKEHKVATVNLSYRFLKRETLLKLIECGIPISVWTVNDEELMRRIFELKPATVTTMQPSIALKVRESTR